MATTYSFTYYVMDPGSPPGAYSKLRPQTYDTVDQNDDGFMRTTGGDTINGFTVTSVWVGDTITVTNGGSTYTVTGVTYYRAGAPAVFVPTDGTVLVSSRFVSSTFVQTSTEYQVAPAPCFTAGTLIETPQGPRRIETLQPGDLVITRDNGAQPLRWIGQRQVPGTGENAPIRFQAGAIGNTRALEVSPQHRMLIEGWRAELYFGQDEVLVAAKHLVNGDTICRAPTAEVHYIHLLFDRHEIIQAEGVASESFHPGDHILNHNAGMRAEIVRIFPELAGAGAGDLWETARYVAKAHEAKVYRAA